MFSGNERRIQGGHLEYLINNFAWDYSLGEEFIPLKGGKENHTSWERELLSSQKQTPDSICLRGIQVPYILFSSKGQEN